MHSAALFFLEKKATGCKIPLLLYWERAPPIAYPEESVSTTVFLSGSYCARIGALMRRVFSRWKASLHRSDQTKGTPFLVSAVRGIAIVEKLGTNSL